MQGNFVIEACKELEKREINIGHYNMIFVKPLDINILHEVCENYSEIIKHLPHRKPFLFIDEIVSIELGKNIHAIKAHGRA